MSKITPILLAGGNGSHSLSASCVNVPKPFSAEDGALSLFQQNIARVQNSDRFLDPIVVVSAPYEDLAQQQLDAMRCTPSAVICEPMSKDTSAAVLLAVELVEDSDSGLFLAMPCEYVVGEQSEFFRAIDDAACAAQRDGLIVAFGTTPSYADTNLGYMRAGAALADRTGFRLKTFVERPGRNEAEQLVQEKRVFWNTGMFLFDRETLQREFQTFVPQIDGCIYRAVCTGHWCGTVFHPDAAAFSNLPAISINYAIMERTERAAIVAMDAEWSALDSRPVVRETDRARDRNNAVGRRLYIIGGRDAGPAKRHRGHPVPHLSLHNRS